MTPGLETPTRIDTAKCFIALCTLSEILGDILPLVYERHQRAGPDVSKVLRRLETDLDSWEDSWPAVSIFRDRDEERTEPVSGSSSLRLGFLSAKMLICRIAFRASLFPHILELVCVLTYGNYRMQLTQQNQGSQKFSSTPKPCFVNPHVRLPPSSVP
jgi:hypothetical protein